MKNGHFSTTVERVLTATTISLLPSTALAQAASPTFLEQNQLAIAIIVFLYILPSLIAHWRKHPSKASIIIVNLIFGWTLLGWLIALIWACGKTVQAVTIVSPVSDTKPARNQEIAPAANSMANKSAGERIADLKAMLDSGAITEAEFALLKADALKSIS